MILSREADLRYLEAQLEQDQRTYNGTQLATLLGVRGTQQSCGESTLRD